MTTTDKYVKKFLADAAKQAKELERIVPKIPKMDGFVGRWVEEKHWYGGENRTSKSYVLENTDMQIKFVFKPGGDGSTSFLVEGRGWLSFDRTGVESSFYWKPWDYKGAPKVNLSEVLTEQLVRIAGRRVYYVSAIKIPQIGHTVSPDSLPKLREQLKKNTHYSFMPSGFGTGYRVSTRRLQFGKRASAELEKFMDVGPLYVETFDAD